MTHHDRARRYAVGVCTMVAAGDLTGANDTIKAYLREAHEAGVLPFEAMYLFAQSTVGAAVSAAEQTEEGAEAFFRTTAFGLAVN